MTAAAALLAVFVWQVGALLPAPRTVTFVRPDGTVEQAEPPAELTRLQPGSTLPSPARGGARFIMRFGLLGAAALAGRKVFKLRLESP